MMTVRETQLVSLALLCVGLLAAGCKPGRGQPDPESVVPDERAAEVALAQEALVTFFDKLAAGRYAEAIDYYGGDYGVLTGWNPDVEADDHATLWRNGCSVNGLNCLATRSVTPSGFLTGEVYLFSVDFSTREGKQFVLGPCCGVTETEQPPRTFFDIRVVRGEDGVYRVIDLPPYTP